MKSELYPSVTVITVTYNCETVLENTIRSVISQSYPNLEYIIIDGASTDSTLNVIKKYENKITRWISEPDKGIYDAMNKGVMYATGDWINFMNAGDLFYADNTLTLLSNLFCRKELGVVYGDNISIYDWGSYLVKAYDLSNLQTKGIPFCHQSSFVRRDLLTQFKFAEKYKICADYNLFYNLYISGIKFGYLAIIVCRFYACDGYASQNYIRCYKEQVDIRKGKISFLKSFYLYCSNILQKILPVNIVTLIKIRRYAKDNHLILLKDKN